MINRNHIASLAIVAFFVVYLILVENEPETNIATPRVVPEFKLPNVPDKLKLPSEEPKPLEQSTTSPSPASKLLPQPLSLSCQDLVSLAKEYRSTDFARNGAPSTYLTGHLLPVADGVFQMSPELIASIESECSGLLGKNLLPKGETPHCTPPETANTDQR